jgi:hypothetical protein
VKNRFQNLPFKCNLQRYNLVLLCSSLVYSQMKYRVKIDSPSGGVCIALLQSQVADKFSRMPVEWIDAINKVGLYKLKSVDP